MPDAPNTAATPRQHGAMEFSDPVADLEAVRRYRLQRLRDGMKRHDYAGLLLFDQINTRYATDATNMQIWCSHYETRSVFIAADGPCVLFDYFDLPHLAEDLPTIDEYRVMPGFYYFTAGPDMERRAERFADQVGDLMHTHGGGNTRLAVDRVSHIGSDALRSRGLSLHNGQAVTEQARAVKSPEELALMRHAIAVCETAIGDMHAALEPGITENALWAKLHEANIRLGGEWIETRLLSSGPRTNPWFRECSMRPIEDGDLVCFDTDLIGPYGYCADISRAWRCGDGRPSDEQRRLYAAAHEQVRHNTELLKPGMSFREVSEKSWPIPESYAAARYPTMIHGVGLADEYPSIKYRPDFDSRGYDGVLEPNMTLCVESFVATPEGREGVKLEEQVLVTETGCELLSSYPMEEEWL